METYRSLHGVVAAVVLGLFAAVVDAEDRKVDREVLTDEQFVQTVSELGMAQVKISQIAAEKAATADVKMFAQSMVNDHTKANNDLAALAAKKNLAVAKDIDKKHQEIADRMSKLSGADFDRTFMTNQIRVHEDAIAILESYAKNGKDADLKSWAEKTLPTMKEHMKMARDVADKLRGSRDRDRR